MSKDGDAARSIESQQFGSRDDVRATSELDNNRTFVIQPFWRTEDQQFVGDAITAIARVVLSASDPVSSGHSCCRDGIQPTEYRACHGGSESERSIRSNTYAGQRHHRTDGSTAERYIYLQS